MIIKAGSHKNQTLDRVPFNYYKNQTLAKALKGPQFIMFTYASPMSRNTI